MPTIDELKLVVVTEINTAINELNKLEGRTSATKTGFANLAKQISTNGVSITKDLKTISQATEAATKTALDLAEKYRTAFSIIPASGELTGKTIKALRTALVGLNPDVEKLNTEFSRLDSTIGKTGYAAIGVLTQAEAKARSLATAMSSLNNGLTDIGGPGSIYNPNNMRTAVGGNNSAVDRLYANFTPPAMPNTNYDRSSIFYYSTPSVNGGTNAHTDPSNINASAKAYSGLALQIAGYNTVAQVGVQLAQATIQWMGQTAAKAVSLAASFEQSRMAFGAMLGDLDKGTPYFAAIQAFAYTTPLSLSGTTKAAQTLLGFGVEAENMIDVLGRLGDAARGNDERLAHLALVYGQVKAQTRAMTQDLYQFVNSGVPIFQLLADSMGVTTGEIKALAPLGKITFEEIDKAIIKATESGGLFYNLMDTVAQSTQGQWQIALDNWDYTLSQVGNIVLPIATAALNAFNSIFKYSVALASEFTNNMQGLSGLKAFEASKDPVIGNETTLEKIKTLTKELATNIIDITNLTTAADKGASSLDATVVQGMKDQAIALQARNSAISSELMALEKQAKAEAAITTQQRAAEAARKKAEADKLTRLTALKAGEDAYAKAMDEARRKADMENRATLTWAEILAAKTAQYNTTIDKSEGLITRTGPWAMEFQEATNRLNMYIDLGKTAEEVANEEKRLAEENAAFFVSRDKKTTAQIIANLERTAKVKAAMLKHSAAENQAQIEKEKGWRNQQMLNDINTELATQAELDATDEAAWNKTVEQLYARWAAEEKAAKEAAKKKAELAKETDEKQKKALAAASAAEIALLKFDLIEYKRIQEEKAKIEKKIINHLDTRSKLKAAMLAHASKVDRDLQKEELNKAVDLWGQLTLASGTALIEGAEGWEKWADVAKDAIASVVEALGKKWLLQGLAESVDPATWGAAAGHFAAGTAAMTGAGIIRAMADGGIVTRPTRALIGEAGPEAVIPLKKAGPMLGSTTIINQYIAGSVLVEKQLRQMAIGAVAKSNRGY